MIKMVIFPEIVQKRENNRLRNASTAKRKDISPEIVPKRESKET